MLAHRHPASSNSQSVCSRITALRQVCAQTGKSKTRSGFFSICSGTFGISEWATTPAAKVQTAVVHFIFAFEERQQEEGQRCNMRYVYVSVRVRVCAKLLQTTLIRKDERGGRKENKMEQVAGS